ncbi:uncharacterized protein CEXT_65551 [Caerostris extrusa]|uniref:Cuticle protein n=1 Tax=Caerostris extrusa TaxID=172846 RepID=A0AAV4TN05_CAEEX|nr:uncharacterized protein CEXT_65551 [Caerostris extrusa]
MHNLKRMKSKQMLRNAEEGAKFSEGRRKAALNDRYKRRDLRLLRCPRSSPSQRSPGTRPSGQHLSQHQLPIPRREYCSFNTKIYTINTPDSISSCIYRGTPTEKKGSYTIADIDGRARRVDYVADGHGFRATVKTNEPGTAASAPAAALIASPYAGPVAPVVNHVAPAAVAVGRAASYTAPLAVAAPVAYGGVIGHGAALSLGAPLRLAYGAGLGLAAPLDLLMVAPLDWDMSWALEKVLFIEKQNVNN